MSHIKLFESKKVRSVWNEEQKQWYFSIIDVIEVLTDSTIPKRYWSDLKKKLTMEGSEVYDKIVRLKMLAEDGKKVVSNSNFLENKSEDKKIE
jgi:DNA-damage-inducible protein D